MKLQISYYEGEFLTENEQIKEVKEVLMKILHGIQLRDNDTYKTYVKEDLTCFEPESQGFQIDGLDFHLFFGKVIPKPESYHLEIVRPTIRVFSDTAYASYTLLVSKKQGVDVKISSANETRIFQKEDGIWKMIHFHRSNTKEN
ncbi:MAG: hypothetical protein HeimC3_10630 [Candidatus Heimdallarchaeota archaeon LC_3]|nr:MAG: hypothetical protein HeimC3_10630 [Candidatus Heimdallarchaeota archaeon LC_3]